jgi:hypothetical protein
MSANDVDDSIGGLMNVIAASGRKQRIPQLVDDQRNEMWQKHLVLCRDRRDFESKYRMTEETFHKLVDVLSPRLDVNVEKSRNSSSGMQPLDKRFIVAVGLRWLAGCDHNGLDEIYGISRSSSHRLVDRFIDAVNCNINNITFLWPLK